MADKQVGDLTASGALDGSELVHVVQGGNSRKSTSAAIAALAAPAPVRAAAYQSGATTSCASGVWTTINDWTALREDLGDASYSAATGQITITAATAGWWNLYAAFGPSGGAADVGTRIRKNASTILAFGRIQAGTTQTDTRVVFCAGAAYLAAGDTIEVQGLHSKGSATTSTGISTVFSMSRMGEP